MKKTESNHQVALTLNELKNGSLSNVILNDNEINTLYKVAGYIIYCISISNSS